MATVSKLKMTRRTCKMGGFTVIEICIVVVLIALLAAVLMPAITRDNKPSEQAVRNACIYNLRLIDSAKHGWAMELNKQNTDIPAVSDIAPYMGRGSASLLPICPNDPKLTFESSYSVNSIGTKPTCKIVQATHILP